MSPLLLAAAGLILAGTATAASKEAAFIENKKDVMAVVLERVRRAPDDAQRALKAGENRLRRLHDDYKVARSTPPTSLEGDVRELSGATARVRLARSRGRSPETDPRAEARLGALWDAYRARVDALAQSVPYKREGGASETTVYWDTLRELDALSKDWVEAAAYNPPPGERSAEDAVAKDRGEVLKLLEDPARLRGRLGCIKAPEEIAGTDRFDAGPFYRAAGLLPGAGPLRKGSFELPPGCRTVTQRESGVKLILRASVGRGAVVIGTSPQPLAYDYVTVPPEAPYLVENGGDKPLDVEYIALEP